MRKKPLVVLLIIACILIFGLSCAVVIQNINYSKLNKSYQQLEAKNKELTSSIEGLNSSIASLNSHVDKLNKELKTERAKVEEQKKKNGSSSGSSSSSHSSSSGVVKTAYLTFDDGPSSITPKLLDELKKYNVKATFFVIGKDTPERRAWIKRESDEGHTVGIHSWTHKYNYIYSSEKNYLDDYNKIRDLIVSATGKEPKFLRFPGGTNNTVSLKYHNGAPIIPALLDDLKSKGVTPVDWNAGGLDAKSPVPSKATIVDGVVNICANKQKAIILLHDSDTHASSVEAVPEIITKLRKMGFTFKPLTSSDEAFAFKPAAKK
jgi:peptidoglycan/xylan/chitin deacetylase (PgdA/CDA1 family)